MQSDIKLENETVAIEGQVVNLKATDFMLDNPDRRKNNSQFRRALVHNIGDKLTINYGNDYPGGVEIEGNLEIVGEGFGGCGSFNLVRINTALLLGGHNAVALIVRDGNKLSINDAKTFEGGTEIDGQVRIEELHGHTLNAIVCKTTDLILDSEERRSKDHTSPLEMRRALVHDVGDKLTINYGGDYPQGVKIEGSVSVTNINVPSRPVPGDPSTALWGNGSVNLIDIVFDLRDKDLVHIKRNKKGQITKIIVENRLQKGASTIAAQFTTTTDIVDEVFDLRDEVADLRERLTKLEQKVNQPGGGR